MIQGFVYTHELRGIHAANTRFQNGSRDTTRTAFKEGIIENGEAWMDMIRHRNLTSHTYNEDTAEEVVSAILNIYYSEFKTLLAKIEQLKQE